MRLGPHAREMGKLEARHRLTVVRKLCGQSSMGPSGVSDQVLRRSFCSSHPHRSENRVSARDTENGTAHQTFIGISPGFRHALSGKCDVKDLRDSGSTSFPGPNFRSPSSMSSHAVVLFPAKGMELCQLLKFINDSFPAVRRGQDKTVVDPEEFPVF